MLIRGRTSRLVAALSGVVLALLVGSSAQAAPATDVNDTAQDTAATRSAPQARADCTVPPGWTESYVDENGNIITITHCPGDDSGGDEGGGGDDDGSNQPACEYVDLFNDFCDGPNPCWINDPAAIQDPPELEGVPKPSPDSYAVYYRCLNPDGSTYDLYYWSDDQPAEPPLEEQAMTAYGLLVAPDFTLAFNPPQRTFVNLDTWWWADGVGNDEITGSSAFGVVAIATPDHIEVDPGDGSGSFTCSWVTSRSDACIYAYAKASVDGAQQVEGQPAYEAQARLVYSVRFENDGAPLELDGLPTQLVGPWQSTPVPVGEIQAIVE